MGWFDEQIRERKDADRKMFEDSFQAIAGAVMGKNLSEALNDERTLTADAFAVILRYYHIKAGEVPEDIKDMNEVLEFLMRPHGIMRRSVRLDRGWYKDSMGALLGRRTDDGSVIALIPRGISGYVFYDRDKEQYVRIGRKNEDMIDTEALAFYKPFPLKSMNIADLVRYLFEQIRISDYVMLFSTMGAATLVGMLLPKLNSILFSDVLSSKSVSMLLGIAIYMLCATISTMLVRVVSNLASERIGNKLDLSVESASMMRVLTLPAGFFKDYSAGELSNRIAYINSLANQLVSVLFISGLSGIFSLAYIGQINKYAPALLVPSILIILSSLLVSIITMVFQVKISKKQMTLMSKESGLVHSLITGVQKIRLSGAEQRAFAKWADIYSENAALTYNPPIFLKLSSTISLGISLIGSMVLYFFAVKSGITVSDYYAFNSAYGMVSGAFLALISIAMVAAGIKPILEMVEPILKTVPEIDENKTVVTSLMGGIELSNVTFRYRDDMPNVIDNLSLKIRPGQYVAIVGKTGCGKSTLMRLLLGFEKPNKGAIYYDGRDLTSLDPKSLRRRIGSVMQDGKLFMGDIYSNIVISAPWLTLDDAWEAAKIAGFADDIAQMPMGMNTMISEGQGGISGGQKQRLMIARAVAAKPKILMFDEATSALDNITQKQVSDALDGMKCTRLVIAHRLSTIKQCDRIIVLEKGNIIEDGTYDELIKKNGFFSELVKRQQIDEKD